MNFILPALLLLSVPNEPTAVSFLDSMQSESGGFVSQRWGKGELTEPTLRTTRTALRAYRLLGGTPPNREKTIGFLKNCYDKESGGFSSKPSGVADPVSTSVALMICGELNLPVEPYLEGGLRFMNDHTNGFEQVRMVASSLEELHCTVPNVQKWLLEIAQTQNSDGSFGAGAGRARATALNVVAQQRLGAEANKQTILGILREGQREDGGFGNDTPGESDLEACYRVVRLYHRFGVQPPQVAKLRTFIANCRNDDGGYGRTPDEASSLHGTYYATIIRDWLHQLEFSTPKTWSFDATEVGAVPSSWTVDRTLDAPGSEWNIAPDNSQSSNRVLIQSSSVGPKKQFNLCVANESFQDVAISVKLRSLTGKIDRGGGVVWRYKDSKNYYIARWNPLELNLRMYKVVDGVRSQLDTARALGDPQSWHTLKIVTVGRDIRGYFDGQLLTEAEDDQFRDSGRVGLWTKSDAVTQFDDFTIQSAASEMIEDIK